MVAVDAGPSPGLPAGDLTKAKSPGLGIGGIVVLAIVAYFIFHHSGSGIGGGTKDATIEVRTSDQSVCWSGAIGDSTKEGCGDQDISVHDDLGAFSSNAQKQGESGTLTLNLVVDGETRDSSTTSAAYGIASVINH